MIVYKATNCLNNKVYFAVSSRTFGSIVGMQLCQARTEPKKMKLKDDYTGKSPFHKALIRYGEFNFKFELLHDHVSNKKAYVYKKEYIKEHNAMNPKYGYNCTTGGMDSFNHADHVIDRLIVARTGSTMPDSYVELMKARVGELHPCFGYKHTKEARENMRQGQINSDYIQSEESKKQTSETMKRRWQEPEIIEKMSKRKHGDMSKTARERLSVLFSGEGNPMYGIRGKDHHFYGKHHTKESKEIVSKKNKEHAKKRKVLLIEKYKNRTEKKCTKCNKVKPVNEFDKSYNSIDPIIARCKPCEKIRAREKYYRLRSPNKTRNRFGKLIKDVIKESK